MRFLTLPETVVSDIFLGFNYGNLDIKKATNNTSVLLQASIRNINGAEVIRKDYTKQDLAFDETNFAFSTLCVTRAEKQLNFRLLVDKLQQLLIALDIGTFIRAFIVLSVIAALLVGFFLRATEFLLTRCCGLSLTCKNM